METVEIVKLNADQQKTLDELIKGINNIESFMSHVIDETNTEQVSFEIARRTELLAGSAKYMAYATALYDNAQGQVAEYFLNTNTLPEMKANIQLAWMKGKLAKWNAYYVRTEQIVKKLDASIKGLVSILSFEKELIHAGISNPEERKQKS